MLSIHIDTRTWTIHSMSIIFTLNRLFTEYIPLNFNLTKLILLIPKLAFLEFNLSIYNDTVSTKIYDKRDNFDFDIVNFPFVDGDIPWRLFYGVYISQLIGFTRTLMTSITVTNS